MAHRLKRDSESIAKAREILSATDLLGRLAYSADDGGTIRAAEAYMNSVAGSAAVICLQLRVVGDNLRRQLPTRLHRVFGIEASEKNDFERLGELKA